jgi:hypothetical protein
MRGRQLVTRGRVAGTLALAGCLAAGFFAVGALGQRTSSAPVSPLIVVDQTIGGIAIGASEADVTALYGSPARSFATTLGAGDGLLFVYRFRGGFLVVTFVDGSVVTVETTSRYHHTDAAHGSWGPGRLFSRVSLPGAHEDYCSEGLWNATSGKRIATIITRAGDRIASVWITLVEDYSLCQVETQEPSFPTPPPPPTTTGASPAGPGTGPATTEPAAGNTTGTQDTTETHGNEHGEQDGDNDQGQDEGGGEGGSK